MHAHALVGWLVAWLVGCLVACRATLRATSHPQTPEADSVATEIMSRQCLNAEIAAKRALEFPSHSGGPMDWLLHIDIDELFFVSSPASSVATTHFNAVAHHFAQVPPDIQYVAYVNHEAVPEHAGDVHNYFTEISLFKRNPNVFKRQAHEVRACARACVCVRACVCACVCLVLFCVRTTSVSLPTGLLESGQSKHGILSLIHI